MRYALLCLILFAFAACDSGGGGLGYEAPDYSAGADQIEGTYMLVDFTVEADSFTLTPDNFTSHEGILSMTADPLGGLSTGSWDRTLTFTGPEGTVTESDYGSYELDTIGGTITTTDQSGLTLTGFYEFNDGRFETETTYSDVDLGVVTEIMVWQRTSDFPTSTN